MAKGPKSEEPESKESLSKEVIAVVKNRKETAQIIIRILTALIIALLLFIGKQFLWPPLNKAFFNHVTLAATIRPSSTIFFEGNCLNLEITCQVTNHTSYEINIHQFNCYHCRRNFLTKIKLKSKKGGKIEVLNFEPATEISREALPSEAFGIYNVYLNIQLPNQITEIKRKWELNDFELRYAELREFLDLIPKEIILVIQTNPDFEDDAIIHLFRKQQ